MRIVFSSQLKGERVSGPENVDDVWMGREKDAHASKRIGNSISRAQRRGNQIYQILI